MSNTSNLFDNREKYIDSSTLAATTQQRGIPSQSIPLPSTYVSRTESEVQLALDVAIAERRDKRMFHRLINGIHERHRRIAGKSVASNMAKSSPGSGFPDNDAFTITNAIDCLDPVRTIAKIVDTHHANFNDSTNRLLVSPYYQLNVDEGSGSHSQNLAIIEGHKPLSDSTLSDGDWSITGYEPCITYDNDLPDTRTQNRMDHDEDEAIFILDI
jgi:hypothetical protein